MAKIRDPKAENATDDIDRSVWLMPADQKWIVKSVVEKEQSDVGSNTPTVVSRKAGYHELISFTGQPQ